MKPDLNDVILTAKNDEASLVAQIAQLNGALMYVRQFQTYLKTDKPEPNPAVERGASTEPSTDER